MDKTYRLIFVIILTSVVTFVIFAYVTNKATVSAFVSATYEMEAFNELHRIKSWNNLEQLLVKGCNKEALEYIRMEQSLELGALKSHLDKGVNFDKKLEEENHSILNRAKSFKGKGRYEIPTC